MASETTDSAVGLRRRRISLPSCRRPDSNWHYMDSQPTDSAVGLRRHSLRRLESHQRGKAYETSLGARTLPASSFRSWKRWDSHPVVPKAAALQAGSVSLPSTLPWGDRRDSHPLGHGPHPCASTASASITVRPGGIAPLVVRLSARCSAVELRTENLAARSDGLEPSPLDFSSAPPRTIQRRLETERGGCQTEN